MIVKLLLAALVAYALWRVLRPMVKRPPLPSIDEREARAVLGVGAEADADTIRAAHRRLLGSLHPDRGGSAELTRRVNAARDVLLRR